MFSDLGRAFEQLGDPAIRKVIWISIAGALAVMVLLVLGAGAAMQWLTLVDWGWLDGLIDFIATFGAFVLAFMAFPAIAVTISTMMLEDVAEAVEQRHYPGLGPARPVSVLAGLVSGLRFFAVWLGVNLVAFLLTLVLPGINLVVFYAVNGYLLGREYYEIVALRRLPAKEAAVLRRSNRGTVFLAGLVIAVLMTVPLVNLLAPIVAAAFMVHVFQRLATKISESS